MHISPCDFQGDLDSAAPGQEPAFKHRPYAESVHFEPEAALPYRLRFQVLPQLAPQNQDPEKAWTNFVDSQNQLLETLRSGAGLAIDKVSIKSPVYARITYNIYGAFRMLAAHQSRHIWQIEQILKALDYQPVLRIA